MKLLKRGMHLLKSLCKSKSKQITVQWSLYEDTIQVYISITKNQLIFSSNILYYSFGCFKKEFWLILKYRTTELVYVGSIPTLGIHLDLLVQSGQFSLVALHWLSCSCLIKFKRPTPGLPIFPFLFEDNIQQNHGIIVKILP